MLKKVFCVILAIATIVGVNLLCSLPLFYGLSDGYTVYLNDNSSIASAVKLNSPIYPFMAKVKGESCKVKKDGFSVDEFFKERNATILFTEELDGITCYYGYSEDIKFNTIVGDKIVNLQVAVAENSVTVGSPIIFGSF